MESYKIRNQETLYQSHFDEVLAQKLISNVIGLMCLLECRAF
jgi:hypothetical protein